MDGRCNCFAGRLRLWHNKACQFPLVGLPATALRVVRGGSWNNTENNARARYRNDNDPANRNNNLGLRVVRSSHIVIPLLWRSRGSVF